MITLDKAKEISRDDNGVPFSWRGGETIATFKSVLEAENFVNERVGELDQNMVFFTGSASALNYLNSYLTQKLKEASKKQEPENETQILDVEKLIQQAEAGVQNTKEGKKLVEEIEAAMSLLLTFMRRTSNKEEWQEMQNMRYNLKSARHKVRQDMAGLFRRRVA